MSITRREAIKGATVAAGMTGALAAHPGWAQQPPARGYGTDPKLTEPKVSWPRTLAGPQVATLAAVVAVVLPATDGMPSGIDAKVPAFVDEWVSAPYPVQQAARERTLLAFAALDAAARAMRQRSFATAADPAAVFQSAWAAPATAELLRDLVQLLSGGYASSNAGMAAIGYVGNTPLERFEGPPPSVVARIDALVAGVKA